MNMSKKIILLFFIVSSGAWSKAQTANDYVLIPGNTIILRVNTKMNFAIKWIDNPGSLHEGTADITQTPEWMLNGNSENENSNDGNLKNDLNSEKAVYTAPAKVPAKNPVAVSVRFHPSESDKSIVTLICNVTIVDAQYKVTFEGEITGPEGMHYKLSGESYTNLKPFADGTFGLMPADNSRAMLMTVSDAGIPGKMWLVSPKNYYVPFVMNVGNISNATSVPAKISIESLSPTEMYSSKPLPENFKFAGAGIQKLYNSMTSMFSGIFYPVAVKAGFENGQQSADDMAFIQRLKQHENDPNYLKTAQGKSDLSQMQKMMQNQGRGNLYRSNMATEPGNITSYNKAFVQGMQATQTDPAAYSNGNTNTPEVLGGMFHFDGTFNSKNSTAMEITKQADIKDLHGTIKITSKIKMMLILKSSRLNSQNFMIKIVIFIFLMTIVNRLALSQTCDVFPADCPDEGSIQASQNPTIRLGNGILLQEIKMQDAMRYLVTDMMINVAKTLHWRAIEMDEITNLNSGQSGGTPYALRSPRFFGIEFEFIVDKDSLAAWKDWLIEFSNRYKDAGLNAMNKEADVAHSPLYKQYSDSVDHYIKLSADYMTAHQNEGAKLFDDKQLTYLQHKQKDYTDKQVALLNQNNSENSLSSFDDDKKQGTKRFRNASTLEIFFEFNPGVGTVFSSDGEEQVTNYNLPGAVVAKSVHLSEPDPYTIPWHFDQWENLTLLLFGNWLTKTDQYKNYNAVFTLNKQNDEHTPKKIMSDKVQTIAIHVMGNKTNMDKLIQQLNITSLNNAIDKN